jgi:tetratricopeptide (TPR) repeat protein
VGLCHAGQIENCACPGPLKTTTYLRSTFSGGTDAIRLKPDVTEAFNNHGCALQDKGDLDGAIKDFNEAIRLKPDNVETFYNRGLVQQDKGDVQGAIADFQKYLDLGGDVRYKNRLQVKKKIRDLKQALSSTSVSRKAR